MVVDIGGFRWPARAGWGIEKGARRRAPFKDDGSGAGEVAGAGLAAIVGLELVADALVLIERAHPGPFDRADVDEGVVAAAFRRDEAVALVGIEEFHGADRHGLFLFFVSGAPKCVRLAEKRREGKEAGRRQSPPHATVASPPWALWPPKANLRGAGPRMRTPQPSRARPRSSDSAGHSALLS